MDIRFEELIRLQINNDFYQQGYGDDFEILPAPGTQQVLTDYGLLFRKIPGGVVVLYEMEPSGTSPLRPISEPTCFRFLLRNRSRNLYHYTNLPLEDIPNSIFHLHNLQDNQQDGELLLTSDLSAKYLTEDDRVALRPQWFEYTFTATGTTAQVRVLDFFGETVREFRVNKQDGTFRVPVDLRAHPTGRYRLLVNAAQELDFYTGVSLAGQGYFGIIELFRDEEVPAPYRFTDGSGAAQPKTYVINLQRRVTYWKYLVVLQYRAGVDPEDLSILHPDDGVDFNRQVPTVSSGGATVVPFISSTPLQLREQPTPGIQLTYSNGNGGELQIDHLPNAPTSRIVPDPAEDKIYSEIYYYI
ncbi:MAG: hypothetical protein K9N46_09045 [Candidatus Marinimicrobia bacterium]|nr:hypothetical protein [Candidatus Neomarinimicrobiota bacterium]MCF7880871.1 hypothetical protein [Candidatus Neomarinimicrobiota bacterium]